MVVPSRRGLQEVGVVRMHMYRCGWWVLLLGGI